MSQSLAQVYIHIIFSTKHRNPLINELLRPDLQSYIVGTLSGIGSYTLELYTNPDHIHILSTLPRTITIANYISKVKTASNGWMKQHGVMDFEWQDGYGIFSVSSSKVDTVKSYIRHQPDHHNKISFKDELRRFFREYHIDFDERYVWD